MASPSRSNSSCSSKFESRQGSWEIVEGLRGGLGDVREPEREGGFLLKRRKWPMKGWHKRYFFLDKGILKYSKSEADMRKGRLHGCIDVGLSVMAIKKKTRCIDLDTEDNIYHLKVKSQELFDEWVSKLRNHRLYRQNEIALNPQEKLLSYPYASPATPTSPVDKASLRRRSTLTQQPSLHPGGFRTQVGAWLHTSDNLDRCSREISACQAYLLELSHLLQSMEVLHRTYSAPAISSLQASNFDSPKKDKRGPRKWRPKTYSKEAKATLQVPGSMSSSSIRLHASNPNLSTATLASPEPRPQVLDSPANPPSLQEDFCRVASDLQIAMTSALGALTSERDRLKQALDHDTSQTPGLVSTTDAPDGRHPLMHQDSSESRTSIPESLSEFFDAQEVLLSATSSENEASDDDSYISDISDNVSMETYSSEMERENPTSGCVENGAPVWRRSCLPSASPNSSSVSVWNILRRNIGKDLSRVAMPVQLNEPLNTLQRLCEELEYCHLLEKAATTADPLLRMVYVATFAVSGYASSYHRAGGKPFNPVLGETYECDRPDKGFRFIAEQVSHHPPISACHAESKDFTFWQDVRWKNKFWGKSMEIVPVGTTHVMLPAFGDHYEWNKVTSCIHNILSGQRWIEHYGEISVRNHSSNACQGRVTFVKARYWSGSVNEVQGVVTDQTERVVHTLFGKWNESVYCGAPPTATCVWRANPVPPDHAQYYGFTKFAMELNELDPALKPLLPPTDTRFRLDQRLLEEGNVEAAEVQKQRIEQLQRDRRRVLEENSMTHQPRFFKKCEDDAWVSNGTYWDLRRDPGFACLDCPVLW
ncbi:oxysterol-binding protein-related protein 3a isoform X1 [Megalops cyprinoides]|uniref:oxysterol-binding protein-related protein 3a isoform X1 n=1 Tax=Megalops cyprinoides TaxID=118141 RepID=UPI001863E655|nr:oxysterol-binding protein-related protein 3a isoform X1 [Megalops cyprinoides]XP_036371813.1 oxysterol-binding protein-related protein 3a isoform X1 [Megalops cyprinoides]XP_036371814.1 oxysterol-binding protein-related protein 3a isoform X1 [Megalops cyprinoides]XP_036371815.1 oxysterol-binding protein-related protein 3a isoform X1 [Megalops cyprinoides]